MTQVIIPSAGLGSRLGSFTANINKALIPVGDKPAISYIINFYPKSYSFIIALGYKGSYIKEYLKIAHPEKNIKFVDINPFEGNGSGLGYTLKCCKKYIKEDFFFHTNDAILFDKIDFKSFCKDTVFLSNHNVNNLKYRTVKIKNNKVTKFIDKTTKKIPDTFNYTGIAYIKNFKNFNKYLTKISIDLGESDYFINMLKKKAEVNTLIVKSWYDVGDIDDLNRARKNISDFNNLPKEDEFIFFNKKRVIKFFINSELSIKRVARSKLLVPFVPNIVKHTKHMYAYNYVEGTLFSKKIDLYKNLNDFLNNCNKNFWIRKKLNKKQKDDFKKTCLNFYYHKTFDRLNSFYQNHNVVDNIDTINNSKSTTLKKLLTKIDWDAITIGDPARIHGDFHFENILWTPNNDYQFIDWRQDFGGIIEYGDLYYDLAKLYHGIIVDHGAIRNNMFHINISDSKNIIDFEIYRKQTSYECEKIFINFIKKKKLSIYKVKVLTALIFLNIATLHHQPYSIFLYYLGKDMLNRVINE